jgi:catechol 2,3-dioxygenase-like lactoylglutathione lyase family enzyme
VFFVSAGPCSAAPIKRSPVAVTTSVVSLSALNYHCSTKGAAELLGKQADELKIEGGQHGLLAASVADVDVAYEELKAEGVTFVRPPTNQRWGMRTAHFTDPEGNLWEINQSIDTK